MIRQLLIGAFAVIAMFACGGGNTANDVGGSGPSSSGSSSAQTVVIKETEYTMAPTELKLKPGTYTFKVVNLGQYPHDVHVAVSADGTEVGGSTVARAGQTVTFTATLKPGQYTLWCAVNAHRSLGMQGALTVQ